MAGSPDKIKFLENIYNLKYLGSPQRNVIWSVLIATLMKILSKKMNYRQMK